MKERIKGMLYLGLIVFIISLIFNYLDSKNIYLGNKKMIYILNDSFDYTFIKTKSNKLKKIEILDLINYNRTIYYNKPKETIPLIKEENKTKQKNENDNPIVYIYTTHQKEEYTFKSNGEYNITPTVMNTAYMLKEKLKNNNIESIVEERSISKILSNKKWNYSYSYKASRIYLEDIVLKNPELRYFIDIHRDSVGYNKTTITIKKKKYARILFISGLDNKNYKKILKMINELNKRINKKYPNLSRGVYKKQGKGVNGIYNQDFSENCILIEFGGVKNTIEEIYNTVDVVGQILSEYIGEQNENK